jgi:catechol 2,3-dioxygenase-like lactoylglutathione lyase family enzyme
MSAQGQDSQDPPFLVAAEPQLFVSDIEASCGYYAKSLGFSTVFTFGDPPFYAQVKRDGARLNLRHVDHPLQDRALAERESYLAATIRLPKPAEVVRLFAEFQSAGVDFHLPLSRRPWGALDFTVRDPDGNLLCFAGPAE